MVMTLNIKIKHQYIEWYYSTYTVISSFFIIIILGAVTKIRLQINIAEQLVYHYTECFINHAHQLTPSIK